MNEAWDEDARDEGSGGYIVCRACGTRISANREACLRCGEPLEAAPETVSLSTISSGRPLMIAAGLLVAVVAGVAALWFYRPVPEDDVAKAAPTHPLAGASTRPPATDARADQTPQASGAAASAWFDERLLVSPNVPRPPADLQSAKKSLELAVQHNRTDAEAFNGLGQVLLQLRDLPGATDRFERAVELSAATWLYHFNLGYVRGEQGLWVSAASEFRQAVRLMPADSASQFDLAMALHQSGDDEGAIAAYRMAIKWAPGAAEFHLALAASLERAGQLTDAQREIQQFLDMAPSAPNAAAVSAHAAALSSAARPTTP